MSDLPENSLAAVVKGAKPASRKPGKSASKSARSPREKFCTKALVPP